MANWAAKGKDEKGVSVLHRQMANLCPENGLMLPLVRWLYTSNRAHFRRLRKDEMLKEVDSEYQYVLMTGSMDKETRFQELKRETGFARDVMGKWSLSKVDASLRTAHSKRKNEVMFLICDQSSLWMAKSRLAVATEAVRAAVKKLAQDTSRDDIDNRVVKTALDILDKNLDGVVKTVFDVFQQQAQALTAAGKPPKLNSRTKSTACSAVGIGVGGSFFAWHGSQVARWHLMIRTGLRNLSGTKLQAFGVAYGEGIYFAKDLNTSMGYANNSCPIWKNVEFDGVSLSGVNVRCASMCEIINRPEDFTSINPYYVVPNEDYVTTRFVFLFKNNPKSVNAMDVPIPKGLMDVV